MPSSVAADGSGNLWVTNAGNNSVSKLDAIGASATDATGFLSGTTGFTTGPLSGPTAIAIDQSGFAWVTNGGNNTVAKISADGSASNVFQGGGLNTPSSVSIDSGGNAWITNRSGASVTLINTSGSLSNFTGGGIASPSAIAINPK
jgi:streptogramin lyase